MNDAELLSAISENRPGAFDAFVDRYGRRLLAFGLRMCGQREDAEDVFQETLMKAYQGLEKLRDPGAVRTWLFRVASSQCLMKRRKERPERELPLEAYKPGGVDFGEPAAVVDWSDGPDDAAEQAELHAALEGALSALPPELRIVVLLRDVEGLSTQETAEALELGVSAVKMRLHRARLALREHLARYHELAA
ncbi:MAG TPA: RNA polymerase sigma factor [Thermoanaerobaculia bacterium]|jgi:RNA polymerase sigma-70 factor (ECF subfamily)